MEKRNHYLLEITKWTMEELQSEVDGYKQLGGVGVKDTIRKNVAEDELNWRNEKGYYDLTPEEIQEEEIEKKERASEQASNITITKDMVQYWLGDDYENWIDDILLKLLNDENPNALYNLKKEIKDAWDQHLE
jgi:hypothetical protein|tara:strand:- start:307 stop:705 length:399 start_codon:yes stop_codon:yes gene_type:complete